MTNNRRFEAYEVYLESFLREVKKLEELGIKMDISIDSTAPKEALEAHKKVNEINGKLFSKYFEKSSNEFKVND